MLYQGNLKTQPLFARSKAGAEAVFDILVIGAGVVGCAMARRFTLEGARVALVEKARDILDGASKANSAILHTGFDAPEGSLEQACVQAGYREYREIRADFGLAEDPCGANVVAWSQTEMAALEVIASTAARNGVTNMRLLTAAALHRQEPNLAANALGALSVPGESIIDPWSAPYAYLEQALLNGAEVALSAKVTGGQFDGKTWQITTSRGKLYARHVINCAGLYGDLVDQTVLGTSSFTITPRKGQFVVFDKAAATLVSSIILPVPDRRTKGIVLFRTVFGNLVIGPTAEDQPSRTDTSTDHDMLEALIRDAVAKVPMLADMPVVAAYAGLRPASEFKDYRIAAHGGRNWITVGAIRSTGLSGALGIARHVYALYQGQGEHHTCLPSPGLPKAHMLAEGGARDWQRPDPGEIVCHCERVTKREIMAALNGPLAARSLAGLKRQTRVTMGRCQGFYCTARLAELTRGKLDPPLACEGKA